MESFCQFEMSILLQNLKTGTPAAASPEGRPMNGEKSSPSLMPLLLSESLHSPQKGAIQTDFAPSQQYVKQMLVDTVQTSLSYSTISPFNCSLMSIYCFPTLLSLLFISVCACVYMCVYVCVPGMTSSGCLLTAGLACFRCRPLGIHCQLCAWPDCEERD